MVNREYEIGSKILFYQRDYTLYGVIKNKQAQMGPNNYYLYDVMVCGKIMSVHTNQILNASLPIEMIVEELVTI